MLPAHRRVIVRCVIVASNTRDRFAAGEPVAKNAAAMLAAEPIGLIPMDDCQRRRFVDLHVADGINRHIVPRRALICGNSIPIHFCESRRNCESAGGPSLQLVSLSSANVIRNPFLNTTAKGFQEQILG